ncbi:MAG: acyltransferase family protein [Lachnospiraceae bacterium]|nr:acyltransferase family protein [Lachnospiraceae bacterium]
MTTRMKALQGFRFFLMIPIFFVHCGFVENMADGGWWHSEFFNAALPVTFFFLLSGFVLAIGYKDKFAKLSAKEYKTFIKRRFVKLVPIYMITMFIVFIWWLAEPESFGGTWKIIFKFIFSLTMLQTLTVKYWNLFNSVCWFTSAIFICYLLAPILICYLQKNFSEKKAIYNILIAYIIILLLMVSSSEMVKNGVIGAQTRELILYCTPYVRIFYFFIGLSTGMLCMNRKSTVNISGTLLEIAGIFSMVIGYIWGVVVGDYPENNLLYIWVCILLLCSFYKDSGKISKIIGHGFLTYMGGCSMYFFMIHYIVINYGGKQIMQKIFRNNYSLMCCGILFVVTLIFSIGSFEVSKRLKKM